MTDRERIDEQINVITEELDRRQGHDPNHPEDARLILAALGAAGYAIYRPDDCADFEVRQLWGHGNAPWDVEGFSKKQPKLGASYRLVPVGGDS
jgi:hypothetical protein